MSNSEIQFILRVRDEATRKWNSFRQQVKAGGRDMVETFKKNWLAITAAAAAAFIAIRKAMDLAQNFAQFEQGREAFKGMVEGMGADAEIAFAEIREASAGLIDEKSLVESANKALSLGIPIDKLTDIMEVARAKGRDMGLTLTQAFNDISVGIGRAQPLILDNLGLILKVGQANKDYAVEIGKTVLQLTAQDKKIAILNATIDAGQEAIARQNLALLTNKEKIDLTKASVTNFTLRLGEMALMIVGSLLPVFEKVLTGLNALSTPLLATTLAVGGLTGAILILNAALLTSPITLILIGVAGAVVGLSTALAGFSTRVERIRDELAELKREQQDVSYLNELADKYDKLTKQVAETGKGHEEVTEILGELATAMPEVITAWDEEGVAVEANTAVLKINTAERERNIGLRITENIREEIELHLRNSQRLDDLRERYAKLTETQKEYAEGSIGMFRIRDRMETVRKAITGLTADNQQAEKAIQGFFNQLPEGQRDLEGLRQSMEDFGGTTFPIIRLLILEWDKFAASMKETEPPDTKRIATGFVFLEAEVKRTKKAFEDLKATGEPVDSPAIQKAFDNMTSATQRLADAKKSLAVPTVLDLDSKPFLDTLLNAEKILLESSKTTQLAYASSARERVRIEEEAALNILAAETRRALETEGEIVKRGEIIADARNKELKIAEDAKNKLIQIELDATERIVDIRQGMVETQIDIDEAVELSTADSARERLEIEKRFALERIRVAETVAIVEVGDSEQKGEEIAALHAQFEQQKTEVSQQFALRRQEIARQEVQELKLIFEDSFADLIRVATGFNREVEEDDIRSLERRDALANIRSDKERARLNAQFTEGQISHSEFNLRIEEMAAESSRRRVAIEGAHASATKGILEDLQDVWERFWQAVMDAAIRKLAEIVTNSLWDELAAKLSGQGAGGGGGSIFGALLTFGLGLINPLLGIGAGAIAGAGGIGGGTGGSGGGGFVPPGGGGLPPLHSGGVVKAAARIAKIPKAHDGIFLDAPPSEEFPILVRGGETVRTEAQETAIQEKVGGGGLADLIRELARLIGQLSSLIGKVSGLALPKEKEPATADDLLLKIAKDFSGIITEFGKLIGIPEGEEKIGEGMLAEAGKPTTVLGLIREVVVKFADLAGAFTEVVEEVTNLTKEVSGLTGGLSTVTGELSSFIKEIHELIFGEGFEKRLRESETTKSILTRLDNIERGIEEQHGGRSVFQSILGFIEKLSPFHEGGIVDGLPTREFPILVRGGETIRTEQQERQIQTLVRGIAAPSVFQGERTGGAVTNIQGGTENKTEIHFHFDGVLTGGPEAVKEVVEEGMRQLGVTDPRHFFVEQEVGIDL